MHENHNKYEVLFIDDEPQILQSLKRELRKEPYTKFFTTDPQNILDRVTNKNVAVVVSDMRMPKMTGLELLNEVKKINPKIIRIVLSGYTQITTVLSSINSGAIFKYITKPWEAEDDLIPIITEAINVFKENLKQQEYENNLEKENKILNETISDTTLLKTRAGFAIDKRLNEVLSLVSDFNTNIYNITSQISEMCKINTKLYCKLSPLFSQINYEFNQIKPLIDIIIKKMDIEKEEVNYNEILNLLIEKYKNLFQISKIKVSFHDEVQIIHKTKRYLVIFLLEDFFKRIISLKFSQDFNIITKKQDNNYYLIFNLILNLKYDNFNFDENLGTHFYNYFYKLTRIESSYKLDDKKLTIFFKIRNL